MTTPPDPEGMRRAMAAYVSALHRAYLDVADQLPPGERARMPLLAADDLTVAAVGARNLHVIATTDPLPDPAGPEVELDDAEGGLRWRLRFFDPVVAPALGLIDESDAPQQAQVRDALGLSSVVYHLTVPPGSGLTPHHAQHAGTGLAHTHATASRDYDSIAHLAPGSIALVREMRAAETAGLDASTVLLAREISPADDVLAGIPLTSGSAANARTRLLAVLRGSP